MESPSDIHSIMQKIRSEVRTRALSELLSGEANSIKNSPQLLADSFAGSDELRALIQLQHFPITETESGVFTSHRPILGRGIVWVKQRLLSFLRRTLLVSYFDREALFHRTLVQLLQKLSVLFQIRSWRLEDEYTTALSGVATELRNHVGEIERRQASEIATLTHNLSVVNSEVKQLSSVAAGLEELLLSKHSAATAPGPAKSDNAPPLQLLRADRAELAYLLLENRFRGSSDEIRRRLIAYAECFKGTSAPIIDIGAGRGELQEVFQELGLPSYGIDLNKEMVDYSCRRGFDVRHEEASAHLASLPDNSLGGIIAIQVIEHLSVDELVRFLTLGAQKLCAGGKMILETINTASMVALCRNYYRDPTHTQPLHPETVALMARGAGLSHTEICPLHPFPEGFILAPLQIDPLLPPRYQDALEALNNNIERLNNILFGSQDYYLLAQKRAD